jgi:hypothetical protein
MSSVALNEIVGLAAINDSFRDGLLNGRRAEVLRQLETPLDPDENQAVMAIEAAGLREFAIAVQHLIEQRKGLAVARPVEPAVFQPMRWPSQSNSRVFMLHE